MEGCSSIMGEEGRERWKTMREEFKTSNLQSEEAEVTCPSPKKSRNGKGSPTRATGEKHASVLRREGVGGWYRP